MFFFYLLAGWAVSSRFELFDLMQLLLCKAFYVRLTGKVYKFYKRGQAPSTITFITYPYIPTRLTLHVYWILLFKIRT